MKFRSILHCVFALCIASASFGIASASFASAETLDNANARKKLSQEFIERMAKHDAKRAYDLLRGNVVADQPEFDKIRQEAEVASKRLESKLKRATAVVFLDKAKIDDHLERYTYLVKYKKAAILWQLTFYRADRDWKIVSATYHTNLNDWYRSERR